MIRLMVGEYTSNQTGPLMMKSGKMTSSMALGWRYGKLGLNTKEITPVVRRTAMGNSYGLTRHATQANSLIIT